MTDSGRVIQEMAWRWSWGWRLVEFCDVPRVESSDNVPPPSAEEGGRPGLPVLEEVQVRGGRLVMLVRGTNPSGRKKKTKKREREGRGDRGGECRGKSGRDGEGSRMHEKDC